PQVRATPHKITVNCLPGLVMDSYPGSLAQVMTQLVMNALGHAFHGLEGRAGQVTISADMADGDWVELRFADDGRGIPPDIQPKVFEPFFTTQRASGAVGLGLHITFNIVNRTLGGRIAVESRDGEGTTFVLHLPVSAPYEPNPVLAPIH
ncbi:MAG TPA: ATP-binding protein, partial [Azospirillaceae bacterium]|nr:ATP-binding protein [Azospirillaceae bacterium]